MLKKLAILLFLVIFVSSVIASLELDRNIYGPSQNFEGVLKVNDTVSLDEIIKADIFYLAEDYHQCFIKKRKETA